MLAGLVALGLCPVPGWAAEAPISVPVTLSDRRVLVAVTFGGRGPFQFLLDTGGAASLIDEALAHKLGLPRVGSVVADLVIGQARHDLVDSGDLVVGGTFRTHASFAAVSGMHFGEGLQGSLDAGFLTRFPSELLWDEAVWRMGAETAPLPPLAGAIELPRAITRNGGGSSAFLFADVVVNGETLRLALDTGYPGSLRLTPRAAKRVGLPGKQRTARIPPGTLVRTSSVSMGGVDLGHPIAMLNGQASETFADGLIGFRLLRLLNLRSDPASGSLWIRRNGLAPLVEAGVDATL